MTGRPAPQPRTAVCGLTLRRWAPAFGILPLVAAVIAAGSCGRSEPTAETGPDRDPDTAAPAAKPAETLLFPDDIQVADPSVNEFVRHAMNVCAAGGYEPFRLLWSVRHEPLTRDEFDQGWQAVQRIHVRALEPIKLTSGAEGAAAELAYVILADVSLDPTHTVGKKQPIRELVLVVVREQGEWHLSKAPPPVRDWVKSHADSHSREAGASPVEPLQSTRD